ncbi:hypothetical protein [Gemmobacter sp.]|uniref:hypothetical protein n=1 Tax=Gemmobacter sp. TaxID=1898957 RepID=UPI002AFF6AB5|nr:hypothetical protein [Gemmobacter sp.]
MHLLRPATRKIAAALGGAAIALGAITATALPARANSDDMMKVIAGVAAIAIIGSALNDKDDHRRGYGYGPVMRPEPPRPQPGWHQPRPQHPGWHHPQPPRPAYHNHDRCGPYGCDRHGRNDRHDRYDRHDRRDRYDRYPQHPTR